MIKKQYPRIFTIAEKHGFQEIYDDHSNSRTFENEDYTLYIYIYIYIYIELEDELFYAYTVNEYSLDQITKILTYNYITFQHELETLLKRL